MTTMAFVSVNILLISVMLLLIKMINLVSEITLQKWNTFECGFMTQTPVMPSFSMQFFLIMILFLIFDIEISLLFPYPMSNFNTNMKYTMMIFILILLIGLLVEWIYKKLSWAK